MVIDSFDLLAHTNLGIFVTDRNRKILFWHPLLEELTGYSPDDVMDINDLDGFLYLIDEDNTLLDSADTCPLARAIRDQKCIEGKYFLHHKDGYRVPVEIRDFPVRDTDGKVIGGAEIITSVEEENTEEQILDLTQMAYLDELTGIPNRRAMQEEFTHMFVDSLLKDPCIVLLIDIDRFKQVNDKYGHMIGDQVLTIVAQTLKRNLRSKDVICRWGGEEFLILLNDIDLNTAMEISHRLRVLVQHSCCNHQDESISVTISGGLYHAQPGESLYEMLHHADRLLYKAKASGRDRIEVSTSLTPSQHLS